MEHQFNPEIEMKKPRFYIMRFHVGDTILIKIGVSANVINRISSLQTPVEPRAVDAWNLPSIEVARKVETYIKRISKANMSNGEWLLFHTDLDFERWADSVESALSFVEDLMGVKQSSII